MVGATNNVIPPMITSFIVQLRMALGWRFGSNSTAEGTCTTRDNSAAVQVPSAVELLLQQFKLI